MINISFDSLKALGEDSGTHFFGSPMLTKKLAKTKFDKEELFIGQINCEELVELDEDDALPETGMIYIFYDVFNLKYSLYYSKDEADTYLDGFNKKFDNKRYDNPLKATFSLIKNEEDMNEECAKMLVPVPENVKAKLPKSDKYVCLLKMIPKDMYYLGRDYLIKLKECSCIMVEKKHLKKGKLSGAITVNL